MDGKRGSFRKARKLGEPRRSSTSLCNGESIRRCYNKLIMSLARDK